MAITSFRYKYAFLSNFSPAIIQAAGIVYPTVEHFYQAMKTEDVECHKIIAALSHPAEAKKFGKGKQKLYGRKVVLRPDWEQLRVPFMAAGLQAKFQYPNLRYYLLLTGNELLVEGNVWHDNFWGDCSCPDCWNKPGLNNLGRLLMATRTVFQQEKS